MEYETFLDEKLEDFFEQFERIKDLFMQVIWDQPVGLLLSNPAIVFTDDWKQKVEAHWEKISLIRKELEAKITPDPYKEGYDYLMQSLDYFHQAKEFASKSYNNINMDRDINIDVPTLGMAANQINQAVELLRKAIPLLM